MHCLNRDYDYGHELNELLSIVEPLFNMQPETIKNILYLNGFGLSLRYKHMSSDPTTDEAKVAIARTKQIMQEFAGNTTVSEFIKEAEEVHIKIIKSSDIKESSGGD